MQQLQNANDNDDCARIILEAVLAVMVSIRETAARRQRKGRSAQHLAKMKRDDAPKKGKGKGDGSGAACSLIHVRALGVIRKRPAANLSAVADQLALTPSATSRLIDCLVDKQWVRREVPPGNRRTISLYLTAVGTKTFEAAMRESQREIATAIAQLSSAKRTQLRSSMETLQKLFDPQ